MALKWDNETELAAIGSLNGTATGGAVCRVWYNMNGGFFSAPWIAEVAEVQIHPNGYSTRDEAKAAIEAFVDAIAGK